MATVSDFAAALRAASQNMRNNSQTYSKSPATRQNMYTMQNTIYGSDGLSSTPNNPVNQPNFLENYRKTTQELGSVHERENPTQNIDQETKEIISRIKLPTYNDAISDKDSQKYDAIYSINPEFAMKSFNDKANKWDQDNFYYKLRAAEVLKKMPREEREGVLNNFNIDAYSAKNTLDSLIAEDNAKVKEARKLVAGAVNKIGQDFNSRLQDILLRATGQRTSYVDKNGVKHTSTFTSGPGDPEELARRLGENNSFRLYSKEDFKNGELTEEAKSRGPSAWNSKTTNPDETQETPKAEEEGEIIEYTYKPGDTFGQVITNLGLKTKNGLWGVNGDVEYYTQQLIDQGALDERGNIPIGTTIKLRRRK